MREHSFVFLNILIICFAWAPELALGADKNPCPLSSVQKSALAAQIENATHAPYSRYGYHYGKPGDRSSGVLLNFERSTKISDLTDKNGNLFLFRDIDAKYIKGFDDNGKGYVRNEMGSYSYSLSPSIIYMWGWGDTPKSNVYTLISFQNVNEDQLRFPKKPTEGQIGRLRPATAQWPLLKPDTRVDQIQYFDEVKVPIEKENVEITIPQNVFAVIVGKYGTTPYPLKSLLSDVLNSPFAESPDCGKRNNQNSVDVVPEEPSSGNGEAPMPGINPAN